jgi:hypothetical protein
MKQINMQTEPAAIIAAIVVIVEAAIGGLVLFTNVVTPEQSAWLIGFVGVVGTAVSGLFTRSKVYSPDTFENTIASRVAHIDAMTE